MASREGLKKGTIIIDGENTYKIIDMFAYGGSALIYTAKKNESEICTLKEIYPSMENGEFIRNENGQIVPLKVSEKDRRNSGLFTYYIEKEKRASELLERLYLQLDKEEKIGYQLRDKSFLVCNLKVLKQPHLEGRSVRLKGFAEMMNMNSSGRLLENEVQTLSVKHYGCIPWKESIRILRQIAETMKKIHQSGYLYCDFSKGNIFLLKETKTAVFIDFGSAIQKVNDCVETDQFIPATKGYRAPEIAQTVYGNREKRIISEASDVYALITFFYELISGEPFLQKIRQDAEEKPDYFALLRTEEFAAGRNAAGRMVEWNRMKQIGIVNPVAGVILNYILMKGLSFDQTKRIRNIKELLELLDHLESVQEQEYNLYRALQLANQWKYEDEYPLLKKFFKKALPDKGSLKEALEQLGKELLSNFYLGDVLYSFQWLEAWFPAMKEYITPRMKLLFEYSGLAVCNHNGDCQGAQEHYYECEKLKEQIELSQYLDARLRVAESYANCFRYDKAYKLMKENKDLLHKRKECYEEIADKLGVTAESIVKTVEYGKNLNAFARYAAFQRKEKEAKENAELAVKEFEFDESNRIRAYNSALQMAISFEDKNLFNKYYKMCIGTDEINAAVLKLLNHPNIKGQEVYNLYALLKSISVFHMEEQMDPMFWESLKNLGSKKQMEFHPWELIYRHAAILLAEHSKNVDDAAETLFRMSRNIKRPFQEFPPMEKMRELPFDTFLVLHMMTWLQEYRLRWRFTEDENLKEVYQKAVCDNMERMRIYLKKNKCKVVSERQWESAKSMEEKYQLFKIYCAYEYA